MTEAITPFFAYIVDYLYSSGAFSLAPGTCPQTSRTAQEWPIPSTWAAKAHTSATRQWHDKTWTPGFTLYPQATPTIQDPRRQPKGQAHHPLTQERIQLKMAYIRSGVDAYVSIDLYAWYARHFMANYARHSYAIDTALGNILEQFNLLKPGKVASNAVVMKYLSAQPRNPELARVSLMLSRARWDVFEFAEVALAMVLYQASLIAYLSELETAIFKNPTMHINEKMVGYGVLRLGLKPFESFIILASLLPLAIICRQEAQPSNPHASEEGLRSAAISQAWQLFFDANLLQTNFPGTSVICPAKNHLWSVKQLEIIEKFYRFVVESRQDTRMMALVNDVEQVARAALSPPRDYYYTYFRIQRSGLEKGNLVRQLRRRGR